MPTFSNVANTQNINYLNQAERPIKERGVGLAPKALPKIRAKAIHSPSEKGFLHESILKNKSNLGSNQVSDSQLLKNPEMVAEEAVKRMNASASKRTLSGKTEEADPGKKIEQIWDNGKGEIAKESIDRIDTVEMARHSAIQETIYLKEELKYLQCSQQKKVFIKNRIALLEKTIARADQITKNWANSDYFRDLLRGNDKLNSELNSGGIIGAVNEYARIMDEKYYAMPLGVNMRSQNCRILSNNLGTISSQNSRKSWLRIGVISDMSNGFVNLESLKNLEKALISKNFYEASQLQQQMVSEIIVTWRMSKASGNNNVDASAGYALAQLGVKLTTINEWGKAIKEKTLNPIVKINKDNLSVVKETLSETIKKREALMSQQFLQMTMAHLETLTPEDIKDGQFKMLHVLLLNQHSKAIDGSGWNHDEENEMRDMAAIFKKFDGKKLICDGKGPFIDLDGNIHLPELKQLGATKELKLRSLCVNQSVQGYIKNDGSSKEINARAQKKLIEMEGVSESSKKKMEEIFGRKKAGYSSGADLAYLAMKAGFKVAIGCLSAKDRTGFVAAQMSQRTMREGGFSERFLTKIIRNQLKETSPAVRVIKDNTGTSIMKLSPFFLEGITDGKFNAKSFAVRSATYVKQGGEILKERQRIKKLEKAGRAAEAAGH